MLRYEVKQFLLEDQAKYFLPLPKLNPAQLEFIAGDLRERGFSVTPGTTLKARDGDSRFVINPAGLASSSGDLLDAVVPSVARVLHFSKAFSSANPYFAAKSVRAGLFEVHFFPRLEGLGRWNSLRRQGQCGLTPDEALVLRHIVEGSEGEIECVTDYPTDDCVPMQVGRNQYYRCRLPPTEFQSNLRTISSKPKKSCYLLRASNLKLTKHSPVTIDATLSRELGEWCYLDLALAPQNL